MEINLKKNKDTIKKDVACDILQTVDKDLLEHNPYPLLVN